MSDVSLTRVHELIGAEEYEEAEAALQLLLAQSSDKGERAKLLEELSAVLEMRGDIPGARRCCDAALELVEVVSVQRARILHRLGHLWRFADANRALTYFSECAGVCEATDDRRGSVLSRAMVGQIIFTSGEAERGMEILLRAIVELPADAPERQHLIEHAAYLSERMDRSQFVEMVRTRVKSVLTANELLARGGGA